jgi:S-adenosylmethionine decarboxylase
MAHSYELRLTLRFIVWTVFGTAFLAFATGRLAVSALLFRNKSLLNQSPAASEPSSNTAVTTDPSLPLPTYSELKEVPHTVYSSKNFDTGLNATSDSVLARRKEGFVARHQVTDHSSGSHEPAGQHLLIDIKEVDGAFLNSKDRLASAMVDLVNMSGLTMLSYHCHALLPVGVSCVGVLLESHISVRKIQIP